ncbi:5-hydroxyisourate isoform B [Micractinium conductrix]|uniref:hydroxyisourate hydrolase n=1 Tax=Micractinium conductrix TaxID=554055 RepID=A0A2P6UZD6_9CHLO|nr:5-hydroxyisourate isoform B [Micractinium conductrix]|eukprot:PSC67174.1 5-hydroxyisourate isoform B [Micractinium conductrix]
MLTNAAVEQQKITELRLRKTFGGEEAAAQSAPAAADADRRADGPPPRSPITTHVLDTCMGRPAPDVAVTLARAAPGSGATAWEVVARGRTNADGRIGDLLTPGVPPLPGHYRITFDVDEYQQRVLAAHPGFFAGRRFYPAASVEFEIRPDQTSQHFHVPLTWNPFGYSTYRGS